MNIIAEKKSEFEVIFRSCLGKEKAKYITANTTWIDIHPWIISTFSCPGFDIIEYKLIVSGLELEDYNSTILSVVGYIPKRVFIFPKRL